MHIHRAGVWHYPPSPRTDFLTLDRVTSLQHLTHHMWNVSNAPCSTSPQRQTYADKNFSSYSHVFVRCDAARKNYYNLHSPAHLWCSNGLRNTIPSTTMGNHLLSLSIASSLRTSIRPPWMPHVSILQSLYHPLHPHHESRVLVAMSIGHKSSFTTFSSQGRSSVVTLNSF